MSNETTNNVNKSARNFVRLEGYLKDNDLKSIITQTGKTAISGQLTIAVSATEEHRIRFFATDRFNDGRANPNYEALLKMLPSETVTIKTLLEANEGATFDQVKLQASKVWANGGLDVYDRKDEANEIHTSLTLRGNKCGFKVDTPLTKKPFHEEAIVEIEGFVDKMYYEKEGETETGRLIVELLVPDYYKETVLPIQVIADGDRINQIMGNYQRGDSGLFVANLTNVRKEVKPTRQAATFLDGTTEEILSTYTFVNERILTKMTPPYADGDVKRISAEDIKAYSANRAQMLEELEVAPERTASATSDSAFLGSGVSAASKSAPNSKTVKGFTI